MTRTIRISLVQAPALVALLALAASASAAEFGTIKGRFVFEGKPKVVPIQPTQDAEYCSKHQLLDETITVGEDGGLQNVFVYLAPARGKKVEIHESYDAAAAAKEPKILDNKNCRFEPHAMTLWTAHPLEVRNSDPFAHNTNASYFFANASSKFNETVPQDRPLEKSFSKSESYPAKVVCNVHPWMNAYVLVRDNPYMAVTGEMGEFEIENAPAGKHKFAFWHEAKGNLKELKIGKNKADRKGQIELEVPADETLDLGDVTVTPAILGK